MKKEKYKILVLSDLNDSASTILKSTVSLAQMIHGEIHFFHVKKPTDVVKRESQLSAIRTINQEHLAAEKKIQNVIQPISENYNVKIHHAFAIGNVKNEIANYIKELKPDIIVLGKRSKTVKLLGDGVTQFVLKIHEGPIMIAATENAIEPNQNISIGMFNGTEESFDVAFANDLMAHVQKPLKSFKLIKSSSTKQNSESSKNSKTVEYVFEHKSGAIESLSSYLTKSKVNLLCIDRDKKKALNKTNLMITDIKDAINTFNVSLLLSSSQNLNVH